MKEMKETNLPEIIQEELYTFIRRNYIRPGLLTKVTTAFSPMKTDELMRQMSTEPFEPDEGFSEYLLDLIDKKGMTDVEVYQAAGLDRRLFSKIRSDANYLPSKPTVVALAIGMKLDYDETQELLAKAGYTLSRNQLADVIVEYFIKNGLYNMDRINEALILYDQKPLGSFPRESSADDASFDDGEAE